MNGSGAPTVAVLGTGIMGAPMARNLAKAGLPLRVWNRTQEKARALAEEAAVCDSPEEAADGADLLVTMLANGDVVAEVASKALPALPDGAVWLQMSTVGIAANERLEQLASEHGVPFVDSPVLGTKQPAEQAQLTVLASGPEDALEKARPVFDAVGSKTVELGDAGAATRAKLVMNNWVLALVEAIGETLAFAERIGVEPRLLLETIEGGTLDSPYAQMKAKAILSGELPPSFPLPLAAKDARLVLEAAERHGVDMALTEAIARKMERAVELGHGDEDMAATYYATRD